MKQFAISLLVVGMLSIAAASQTASTTGSGSANTSVSPGQASGGASANQNVQAPGASANAGASGNAQVSHEPKGSGDSGRGSAGANASSTSNGAAHAGNSAALSEGSTVHAELTKSLDAKKCKPGDEVTAKVTEDVKSNGKVVVHKGSKVMGHVTEAQAHSKEHADSKLGIAFDKVMLSGGQELAFNGVIQAIAPPAQALVAASADQSSAVGGQSGPAPMAGGGGRAGGGLGGVAGGAVSTVGTTAGATTGAVGSVGGNLGSTVHGAAGGLTAQGGLTSASSGVIGLQGLNLSSATAAGAQGSLITSPTQNVKLDSGTQVLLRAVASAQ